MRMDDWVWNFGLEWLIDECEEELIHRLGFLGATSGGNVSSLGLPLVHRAEFGSKYADNLESQAQPSVSGDCRTAMSKFTCRFEVNSLGSKPRENLTV
jgi:hypothetical protein